jgi:hypothetical protein
MNDKWGYIDEKGEFAIPLQYANADSFSEGLAAVNMTSGFLKSKRYGFINKEGKLVIDYEFNSPRNFSEGLAYVHPIGYIHLKK